MSGGQLRLGQVSGLTLGPVTPGLDLGSWDPPIISTHTSGDRDECHRDKLRDMQTARRAGAESNGYTLSGCHVTLWHPLSRQAWHMLGHDCDLQTDQAMGSPAAPRAAISAFYHQHRQGASRHQMESTAQPQAGLVWVRFHHRLLLSNVSPRASVSKPSKSDKSIRVWTDSASPLFSTSGHMCRTGWSCD